MQSQSFAARPVIGARHLRLRRWMGRYWISVQTLAMTLAIFTLLRLVLLFTKVDWSALGSWQAVRVLLVGLRFDLLVGLIIVLPQVLHLTLHSNRRVTGRASRVGIHGGLLLTLAGLLFLSVAEYLFFNEFESRFNYIAFEYLIYPTEVFSNIWESYPVTWVLLAITGTAVALYLPLRRGLTPMLHMELPWRRRYGVLLAYLLLTGLLWWTTSASDQVVSGNRVANECAGNGPYSFVYYAWTNRFDYDHFYLTQEPAGAVERVVRRVVAATDRPTVASDNPLDRVVVSPLPRRDYNVVLIMEESLGSDFVGVLGSKRGLTPRLDALTREGVLFDNFYATGNRTARALEATLASIPPIPTESILKRDHSSHVYTLARVLKQRDYATTFVYGGHGLFDGMRAFMLANGFDRFIEQHDYPSPTFVSAWGVCDEDIFSKALEEFDALAQEGRPFFSIVLTVSNHKPYTYPDGRIDLPSSAQRRQNAVKYADWALGDFFKRAAGRHFYKDTLFVVMGDHGARVYGSQMFPVKSYRVPVLMILPRGERAGTRCATLASSLDIAPIIMGRLGGSYRSVFYGRDALTIEPSSAYALMQHNHDLVMMTADGRVAMLGCPNTATAFQLDRVGFRLVPVEADGALQSDAGAFYQTANQLYYSEHYFPADEAVPSVAIPESPHNREIPEQVSIHRSPR